MLQADFRRFIKKTMEWIVIPIIVGVLFSPWITEVSCKWRRKSIFNFRVMQKVDTHEIPLPNVEVDIRGLATYKTDSTGLFQLVTENNRSYIWPIVCRECNDSHLFTYTVIYQGKEATGQVLIDITENNNKSTQLIYVH